MLSEFEMRIENSLIPHVEGAIGRLAHIYAEAKFHYDSDSQLLICSNLEPTLDSKKSVSHALYREKIYAETLPLRMKLLNLLS